MARRLVLILIGAALLAVFISRFVLIELLAQRVGSELVAALVEAFAIAGMGSLVRRAFVALLPARMEKMAQGRMTGGTGSSVTTAFILGYPIFGAVCFLIGTIRISPVAMMVPLIVGAAGAVIAIRVHHDENRDLHGPLPPGEGARSAGEGRAPFAFFAIGVVIACGFITAQAPPVSLDEVAYHLAVPRTWALEGRAIDLPLLSHSYFPLGIESADLPLFALLGTSAGTASHFLHLIGAIAVIALLCRRARSSARSGALIAAAIVTTPALAVTTGWSLVEWPLIGIFVIAALAFEDGDDSALAAAIAAGLLTKYTFLPFVIVLILLTRRWKPALLGAAAGSIFFIRNLILTGNPIAPFLSAHSPHVSGFRASNLAAYIFDGRFVDESLGASMLMLVPAAAGALAWIALALAAVLFLLAASSRILLPFLAVGALSTLQRDGDPTTGLTPARRAVHALLILAIASQLLLVVWFTWRDDAFSLIAGRVSDDEYVAARRASYPAIAWLNSVLPADSRTLVVGLNETYWFEHPVRGGGNFDGPRMSAYLSDPALRANLQRDRITHIALFVQPPPTTEVRKREERDPALSAQAQRALAAVLSSGTPASGPDGVRLFTLRRSSVPAASPQ